MQTCVQISSENETDKITILVCAAITKHLKPLGKEQLFISDTSGGWKVRDGGTCRPSGKNVIFASKVVP